MKTKTLNVVMIATKYESKNSGAFIIGDAKKCLTHKEIKENWQFEYHPQHLYFTSNDEIKDGLDVIYNNNIYRTVYSNTVPEGEILLSGFGYVMKSDCKKIEATTNSVITSDFSTSGTTFIPSIPQSFVESYIKAYNEGNPILTVDVEIDCDHSQMPNKVIDVIQTNSANEVIIVEPKIPIYEIWQNNNKVGIFFTKQLADKVNTFLKEPNTPLITIAVPESSLISSLVNVESQEAQANCIKLCTSCLV